MIRHERNCPFGNEPVYLAAWLVVLTLIPGLLAVRRWQAAN
jgi:hypothetical protein